MANVCFFNLVVLADNEDTVKEVYSILSASWYRHQSGEWEIEGADKHLWGVMDIVNMTPKKKLEIQVPYGYFAGTCRWSVSHSMCFGEGSKHLEMVRKYGAKNLKDTSLKKISKEHNCVIEIVGNEPQNDFEEHKVFAFGDTVLDVTNIINTTHLPAYDEALKAWGEKGSNLQFSLF